MTKPRPPQKKCAYCDEVFHPTNKYPEAQYCSVTCSNASRRQPLLICEHCARPFRRHNSYSRFCSIACAASRGIHTRADCAQCGRLFESRRHGAKVCSRACVGAYLQLPVVTCAYCGIDFPPHTVGMKFCSKACADAIRAVPAANCAQCGKHFQPRTVRARYCSRECGWAKQRLSYNFRRSWRGPDWTRISRAIRTRDNHTCQQCGATSAQRRMDVHHIIPWTISHDSSPQNLITLCVPCHRKVETQYWRDHPVAQLRLPLFSD